MAVIKFRTISTDLSNHQNATLTHIDQSILLKYLDSKSKLQNGNWKLKIGGLRGWSGVNGQYEFIFLNRGLLNRFRNNMIKDIVA
jgi:hypothetical protein